MATKPKEQPDGSPCMTHRLLLLRAHLLVCEPHGGRHLLLVLRPLGGGHCGRPAVLGRLAAHLVGQFGLALDLGKVLLDLLRAQAANLFTSQLKEIRLF